MITHPSAAEIARAIAQWIDHIRPQLDARNAYLARVAANGLAIIEREMAQSKSDEDAIAPKLAALLGTTGSYDALIGSLCDELRAGSLDANTPELLATLHADTLAKLAIDQPKYRHIKE